MWCIRRIILLLALGLVLTACGHKGPLTLPQNSVLLLLEVL